MASYVRVAGGLRARGHRAAPAGAAARRAARGPPDHRRRRLPARPRGLPALDLRLARHRLHRPDARPGPRVRGSPTACGRRTGTAPWCAPPASSPGAARQVELNEHDAAVADAPAVGAYDTLLVAAGRALGGADVRARFPGRPGKLPPDASTSPSGSRSPVRPTVMSAGPRPQRLGQVLERLGDRPVQGRVGVDHRLAASPSGPRRARRCVSIPRISPPAGPTTLAPTSTPRSASSTSLISPSALAIQPRVDAARSVRADPHVEARRPGPASRSSRRRRPRGR